MRFSRRQALALGIAAPALLRFGAARAATALKISHQFPGGTATEGDFRDRLCRRFAALIQERSKGAMIAEIYPGSSLMKTNAQFSAMRKGALDMSLIPISYAGGDLPELNIGLMPGLVTGYDEGLGWKNKAIGREFSKYLAAKGVIIVTWIWQAGGAASRVRPLVEVGDAKGMKIRGGSREMDLVLQAAGASVLSLPSNELYAAMQTGACDAALTSSTSLTSFRLEELAKHLTTGRAKSYWFMLEPLVMSKAVFDRLSNEERDVIVSVGAELEEFGRAAAVEDDVRVAKVYGAAGATVHDLDAKAVQAWRDLARDTAWKDYASKNENCARLIKLAMEAGS
ncbi:MULTISPECIES: TRAP transporter substrate-binding protein DctP [unclassified Bradyrhizobium]|uniref:TRAP transporter substrate-binding protein DctP n=1 Tax=unclassified Bradyrhizobium TaxID=2631580 RepID=UPI002478E805|nr:MULTISPECIES: TRAP transporter substrate-binding protein DctP [unclassified Bradyrhizobium]WGR72385.1 TRAP transporter substrate-binding protein DctP [Bradyrhizobium sp. ISRA426]WGR77218.1 TRAP transporter substrate-binding protein DctP [Bradyrhizobium sp. ISRA430]WGR87624.1 TRAP transporter substrate-binding protein DctP [Bradyrhizobium sp. ISRA432]